MRNIKLGTKDIGLKASPLALLFYKQEFKSDLIGDLVKMAGLEKDMSRLDSVAVLQLVWAMNKAHNGMGKSFPGFEKWLDGLDGVDFTDQEFMNAVIAEAEDGFFRGAGGAKSAGK